MENKSELPYVPIDEFNKKVDEFAKTNVLLQNLFANKIKSWEELPKHLIQDLFKKLGCKPSMQKY